MSLNDAPGTAAELNLQTFDKTRSTQERAGQLRSHARLLTADIVAIHDRAVLEDLTERAAARARQDSAELLARLSDAGLAWRDIARMVGVTVAAVQKWRRHQPITGANRLRLARIVGVLDLLEEALIHDVASWLETPVLEGVHVSPLDLLVRGQERLLVQFAHDHCTVEDLLEEFEPDWRATRVDAEFESFQDEDGYRSVRPRRG